MKRPSVALGIPLLAAVAWFFLARHEPKTVEGDFFYAIESAGVLCGYSVVDTSLVTIHGERLILVEQTTHSQMKLLGSDVDATIQSVFHIDPETRRCRYESYEVDQGQRRFSGVIRLQDDGAHCSTTLGRDDRIVELPPGTLLENPLFFEPILRDLQNDATGERVYDIIGAADQDVQSGRFTVAGEEHIPLARHDYDTVIVDQRNLETGVHAKMWLDAATGMCVKVVQTDGPVIYLADRSLAAEVERFHADTAILTKTNVSIADVSGISYMKVRARIRPTGSIVSPDDLDVPGQRFTGTVEDNLIEGVFEIEHPRYDGTDAPPFPPNVRDEADLARTGDRLRRLRPHPSRALRVALDPSERQGLRDSRLPRRRRRRGGGRGRRLAIRPLRGGVRAPRTTRSLRDPDDGGYRVFFQQTEGGGVRGLTLEAIGTFER